MIDVYYWPTVNGRKIPIMLEEVGLPYTIIPVDFTRGQSKAEDYLRINPNGKIPAIIDHDALGGGSITLFESAVILHYLAEKSGKLLPADPKGRYEVMKWLVFQAANIGPLFGQMAHFHDYAPVKIDYAINRYTAETIRLYGVLERRLEESEFLAGPDYSIADIGTWTWIMPQRQEQKWEDWPAIHRWHQTIGARPAVQKGNHVRTDLQSIGVQQLTEEQRYHLYGWQQKGR